MTIHCIFGPPTLVGLGPYNSPSSVRACVRPSVRPSVRAFQKFSMTIRCIFLKFCMELQLYMGEM